MVDLVAAQTELTIALLGDNADLRQTLEGVDATNDAKVKQAEAEAKKAREEQTAEHATYEGERKSFLDKLASFQDQNGKQAAEIASLKGDIERINQDNQKTVKQLLAQLKEQQRQIGKDESVIQRAQGHVTYVDYTRKEIRTTLNLRNGGPRAAAVLGLQRERRPAHGPAQGGHRADLGQRPRQRRQDHQPGRRRQPAADRRPALLGRVRAEAVRPGRPAGPQPGRQGRPRDRPADDPAGRRRGRL